MAVVRKCDRCGKLVDVTSGNRQYTYEEDGKEFTVNSFRLGEWNAKDKQWDSIVSAYDLCYECGKEVTEAIFNVLHGDNNCDLQTRVPKITKKGAADVANNGV